MPSARRTRAAAEFGERVRNRRMTLGLTQVLLAERCGYHYTYISSLERGERNVTLETITLLADSLRIDPAQFVRGLKPTRDNPRRRSSPGQSGWSIPPNSYLPPRPMPAPPPGEPRPPGRPPVG